MAIKHATIKAPLEKVFAVADWNASHTIDAGTITAAQTTFADQDVKTTSNPTFVNLVITGGGDIRPSANSTTALNIAQADGTDFVTFDTTNKRVGIGTVSPSSKLNIQGSAGATTALLTLGRGDSSGNDITSSSGNKYGFICYPSFNVTGATTGLYDMYFWSGITSATPQTVTNLYSIYLASPNKYGSVTVTNAYGLYIDAPTIATYNYAAYFGAAVGLGINAPTAKLHQDFGNATATYHKFTAGTTTGITLTDGFDVGIDASGNAELRQRENLPMYFYTNNTLSATIEADKDWNFAGKVGIGVAPIIKLHVEETGQDKQIIYAKLTDSVAVGSGEDINDRGLTSFVTVSGAITAGVNDANREIHGGDFLATDSGILTNGVGGDAAKLVIGIRGEAYDTAFHVSGTSIVYGGKFHGYGRETNVDGTAYGIYATASGADINWAGYFDAGNVYIVNKLGIGMSPINTLDVSGVVGATRYISNVAIGTMPYVCTSTTLNTNLNADLWDGYQFSDYLDQSVKTASSPTFADITANYIKTGGNEFLAHDAIRHTLTAAEEAAGGFSVNWNTATTKKIVSITCASVDESSATDNFYSHDWTNFDGAILYNGTTISVTDQSGGTAFQEGDIVTIYVVYEK